MVEDKSVVQMQATSARVLQGAPGLAEKLANSGKAATAKAPGGGANRDDRDAQIADLQRQLESEREKNKNLEYQHKHRIMTFVKRETQTKNKIESLERRLNDGTDHDEHVQRMAVIENMHKSVVAGIACIQNNTAKILQDQEKDLMRAFRARLQEVSRDLEAQRTRKGEHSTELQARHRRVVAELHEAQELAQTFDKQNIQLASENKKLVEKLRTREDDRQALLRELVLSRKEAARLKAQFKEGGGTSSASLGGLGSTAPAGMGASMDGKDAAQNERKAAFSTKQIEQARMQQTQNRQYEREVRYREGLQKLKRMVEAERKQSRALKQQQADMMQQRSELEVLLRQCLDDVKAEIMRHRLEHERKDGPSLPGPGQSIATMPVAELTAQDRERVLELLLSQQRVVQLLYSKTFPQQPGGSPQTALDPEQLAKAGKEDDFSWLSDIIPPE